MTEEEFLNIESTRNELKNIIFPENPVTCRSCHKPRINKKLNVAHFSQDNPQNIAPNNEQYEMHHVEDIHVVHNIGPNFPQGVNANIHNNPPNEQNYVTRNEFVEFKRSINSRFDRIERRFDQFEQRFDRFEQRFDRLERKFDRLERSIQALGGRNLNNEAGEEEKYEGN